MSGGNLVETNQTTRAPLAERYLAAIPATSVVSSEKRFTTTGNIVTPKRRCLFTKKKKKNVNMLRLLFRNRKIITLIIFYVIKSIAFFSIYKLSDVALKDRFI